MNLDEIIAAADALPPRDREKLKAHLAEPLLPKQWRSGEEWLAHFDKVAKEFRGDSTDEEMEELFNAMTMKSRPPKPQTVDEWTVELRSISDEIRAKYTEDEIDLLIEAINFKSKS